MPEKQKQNPFLSSAVPMETPEQIILLIQANWGHSVREKKIQNVYYVATIVCTL